MSLIPEKLLARLTSNWRKNLFENNSLDLKPVAKVFLPDADFTALLTELDPDRQILFGLVDHGQGRMKICAIALTELETMRGNWGCPVEVDTSFKPKMPLSGYVKAAAQLGRISV
jgi:hypothetical protein